MGILGRRQKGFSLIEMLIALVIGAIIIAGVYRTFTTQQKTFTVQEQVSEAQQNARAVMDLMARDIRMAGFGKLGWPVEGISETVTVIVGANPAPNREVTLELVGAFGSPLALLGAAVLPWVKPRSPWTVKRNSSRGTIFWCSNSTMTPLPRVIPHPCHRFDTPIWSYRVIR
jgi:prepilin-type N-terminal cleavage/methylation domain-containing protein